MGLSLRRTTSLARRRLLLGALGAVVLVPLGVAARRTRPRAVVRTGRARAYPGRVRPLDLADVRRPARWGG